MKGQAVQIGQCFESVGLWRRIWQVESITAGTSEIRHVRLRDVADHLSVRTLAPGALLDKRRFRPVRREEHPPSRATGAAPLAAAPVAAAPAQERPAPGEVRRRPGRHPLFARRHARERPIEPALDPEPDSVQAAPTQQAGNGN